MFSEQLTSLNRRLRILWLGLRGQIEFQRGFRSQDLDQAKSTFDELAALNEDSFLAHLNLGRIAAMRQQSSLALIHLSIAFQLDPERFYRAPIGSGLKRQIATRQGLIKTAAKGPRVVDSGRAELGELPPVGAVSGPVLPLGDFQNQAEWARFANRPAITPEEIAATDLDALMRQLLS